MESPFFKYSMRILTTLALLIAINTNVVLAEIIPPVSGRLLTQEQILPADVLSRVQWVRKEIGLISKEIGKPEVAATDVSITGAAPREVYYWAETLYHKADRLAFELASTRGTKLQIVDATSLRPFHVWQNVDQALQSIQAVKTRLGIPEKIVEQESAKNTTPSDVFEALAQASHEINQLLIQRISPADVFQQVTVSVNTMAQLLGSLQENTRIPNPPKFERFKTPNDVYKRLLDCYDLLSKIAQLSGVKILKFTVPEQSRAIRTPSDVYDLASLIVSELAYFHEQKLNKKLSVKAYFPGYKTPSHVFQRVGILKTQLKTLQHYVNDHPNWLKD